MTPSRTNSVGSNNQATRAARNQITSNPTNTTGTGTKSNNTTAGNLATTTNTKTLTGKLAASTTNSPTRNLVATTNNPTHSVFGSNNTTTSTTTPASTTTTPNVLATTTPTSYTYGTGSTARSYTARGYGRGYGNSYGGRRGYGQSQGTNRAAVSRLRAVHSSLARIDHDYQGHRARAMHSISMAIRQLSNRSSVYRNTGFNGNMNNRAGMANRGGAGAGRGRRQPMTQAQSDQIMSQALRTTQGVQMQLASQGNASGGHARARGHLQHSIREMNTALSIR